MRRRRLTVRSALLLLLCVAVVGLVLRPFLRELPFSREAWAVADAETRGKMYKDLRRKHPLEGLTQAEVLHLLGEPDIRITVAEMHKEFEGRGVDVVELFGTDSPGRLHSLGYRLGSLNGIGGLFEYVLTVHLKEGKVEWADAAD